MDAVSRDGGSVRVLGVDNTDRAFSEVKEDVGVVLDEAYFPEVLTARQVGSIMKRTYKDGTATAINGICGSSRCPTIRRSRFFARHEDEARDRGRAFARSQTAGPG